MTSDDIWFLLKNATDCYGFIGLSISADGARISNVFSATISYRSYQNNDSLVDARRNVCMVVNDLLIHRNIRLDVRYA